MKAEPEPVEIAGVVTPLGPGGDRNLGKDDLWTLRFSVQPWRRPDGQLDERELRIHQQNLSGPKLQETMSSIRPYDILRARVHLRTTGDVLQAELVELLGQERSDTDLTQRAEQLQKPVTLADPFFGTLTLNRELNWYETSFPWNSRTIHLYLSFEKCPDQQAFLRSAQSLWNSQQEWDERIRDFAAQELLETRNDNWLGQDGEEVSAAQFKERMTLESILLTPDGELDFSFADGGLFFGHVIQVTGTLAEGPTQADIAG